MTSNNPEPCNYDLSYLEELSAGDAKFVKSIITQFIAEAPLVIKKIQVYLSEQNWDDLTYQVHKFAPNLAFIGINDIKDDIYKLENYSKNKTNLEEIPRLVDILNLRCQIAIDCLRKDFEL